MPQRIPEEVKKFKVEEDAHGLINFMQALDYMKQTLAASESRKSRKKRKDREDRERWKRQHKTKK